MIQVWPHDVYIIKFTSCVYATNEAYYFQNKMLCYNELEKARYNVQRFGFNTSFLRPTRTQVNPFNSLFMPTAPLSCHMLPKKTKPYSKSYKML